MSAQTYKKFPLPPLMLANFPEDPTARQEEVGRIVDAAYDRAAKKINPTFSSLSKDKVHKLQAQAEEEGYENVTAYILSKLEDMSAAYVGCRTGMVTVVDSDTGRNITSTIISNNATDLSDALGLHLMEQIYRAVTSSVD